jgi:hypothetical protein
MGRGGGLLLDQNLVLVQDLAAKGGACRAAFREFSGTSSCFRRNS